MGNTWRYVPYRHECNEEVWYTVHEEHGEYGYAGPIDPMGETVEELISDLENMLNDIKKFKGDIPGDYK